MQQNGIITTNSTTFTTAAAKNVTVASTSINPSCNTANKQKKNRGRQTFAMFKFLIYNF